MREGEEKEADIDFAPASMGPLLLYFSVFETLLVASFHILVARYVESVLQKQRIYLKNEEDKNSLWNFTIAMLVICAPAFLVIAPIVLYLGTMQMKALLQLRKQVDEFKIRESQCSCCQMDHCHPDTGEELLCDRMLVFETLKRWYPLEISSEACLDRFDEAVHRELGGYVRNRLGAGAPPLRHVVAITVHPLLGFLCMYVYLAVNAHLFPWSALGWMIGWFQAPPMVYLALWEFLQTWRMGVRFGDRCPLWLVLLLGEAAGISFNVAIWLQYNAFKYTFGHDVNWPVLGSLAFMWITFILPYMCEYSPKLLGRN